MVRRGCTSMPGVSMGSQDVADARRASWRRARCAPGRRSSGDLSAVLVQIFWPLMRKSSPSSTRGGLQAREVAARAGLGVALAPHHLAAHRGADPATLLLLGAVLEQGRNEHRGALGHHAARHAGPVELLVHDDGLEQVGLGAVAAVLLRDRARPVAVLDQQAEPANAEATRPAEASPSMGAPRACWPRGRRAPPCGRPRSAHRTRDPSKPPFFAGSLPRARLRRVHRAAGKALGDRHPLRRDLAFDLEGRVGDVALPWVTTVAEVDRVPADELALAGLVPLPDLARRRDQPHVGRLGPGISSFRFTKVQPKVFMPMTAIFLMRSLSAVRARPS